MRYNEENPAFDSDRRYMKMKKKNIFIMFILIFTLALLGGCGTKNVRVLITMS